MVKTGSIIKLAVKNFVTFNEVELTPGQYLNIVLGANGTGKSTLVAAIILSLGGSPKVVGRGQKISDYIKHSHDNAVITVTIQDVDDKTFSVTREFNRMDQSIWRLNGKEVSLKEIQEYIKKFNIQVNNLCQFLPQDRVSEFAKLNKQNLFKETLIALCRYDLINMQNTLIEKRKRRVYLTDNLSTLVTARDDLKQANIRMDGKIQSLQKKDNCLKKIAHITRKRMWLFYFMIDEKRDTLKKLMDEANETFQRYNNEAKPMIDLINKAKMKNKELERELKVTGSELNNIETALQTDGLNTYKQKIKNLLDEKVVRLQEITERENDLQSAQKRMDLLVHDKLHIINNLGKDTNIDEKLQLLNGDSQKLIKAISSLENKMSEYGGLKRLKENEIKNLEQQVWRLENVKDQRLKLLKAMDAGSHAGTLWLRHNKHLFSEEVFEPLMLEINVITLKHAMYIEKTINFRDKIAFVCTSKNDMNLLINNLNVQQNLGVNVIHAESTSNKDMYSPRYPIEELRRFGFQAYLSSLLQAPEPIMNYLRKTYKIHNIPVAFENNNIPINEIPQNITVFYKGNCKYSISHSKYSGEISTKQFEIMPDNTLSLSVDQVQIDNIKSQIVEIQNKNESFDAQIVTLSEQMTEVTKQKDRIRENIQMLRNGKQQIENIEARIRVMRNKINDLQANHVTNDGIENEFQGKLNNVLEKMGGTLKQRTLAYRNYTNKKKQHALHEIHYNISCQQITVLENKFEDLHSLVKESETVLKKAKEQFEVISRETRTVLLKAKEISGGFSPDDKNFDVFRGEYDKLPNDIEKLDAEKAHLESKVNCLINAADQNEVKEYEERVRRIGEMDKVISLEENELSELNNTMERLMREWLEPIKNLVSEIHSKFSECFAMIDCAGDVSLFTDDDETDFEKYGLTIKVTYRNGEPLQELNNVVQSGGERAVATGIFMLSLQGLTPVPFRCVDEINQGMDEKNERKVYELLVDITNFPDSSQYFLVTPKVNALTYSQQTIIHIVNNGPFNCKHEKFKGINLGRDINWLKR